jgi:TfoX/Sxy family transcriptional regulator of competence genes
MAGRFLSEPGCVLLYWVRFSTSDCEGVTSRGLRRRACSGIQLTMPYSKSLAARIRHALTQRKGIIEKKMFGGVAFLLHGNMLVGVWNDSLIVRLGPEQGQKALAKPNVTEFEVAGRPMKGWVMVEPDGIESDDQLGDWIERAAEFVGTLPAK